MCVCVYVCVAECLGVWGGRWAGGRPLPVDSRLSKSTWLFLGVHCLAPCQATLKAVVSLHGRPSATMPGALALRFRIGTVRYIQSRFVSCLVPCLVFGLESV